MTTNSELLLLHSRPHYEELYLSIYQPTTLFSAQVSSSGTSQGAYIIPYNNASGTYSDVFANSVLLVGTTPGAEDVGRVRIRSIDASNITVAWNADIPWQLGLYLTAINYVDLNPIYPRVVNSGTSLDDTQFFKDWDIPYSNQNSILGAFPCAGPHRAAFLTGGSVNIYYSASGSNHVKGEALTYDWEFEGGTPATYSGITPGNVAYNAAGHYKTKLTVTGSGGSVDVTYRFISIYNRAANGNAIPPIQRWSMAGLQGGRAEGGYSVSFKIYDQIDNIYDGALVILFPDKTTYGGTETVIGSKMKFVGYIQKGSIVYDYENSSVEFTAISVTEMLKNIEAFSISLNDAASPTKWYELQNMTVSRILYHYLRWHTTVLNCTDYQYLGYDGKKHFWDANRDSIYDAINNLVKTGIVGETVSDREGRIWVETNPGAVHDAATVIPVNMSIQKQDWMGEPNIEENITNQFSVLEAGGVVYSGLSGGTGTDTAILSLAPGLAAATRGRMNTIDGLISASQDDQNNLTGDLWAYMNARYGVSLKMAGNYNNIDIAPIQQCLLNISGSDTNRGIEFLDSPFHPIQVDWVYDFEHSMTYPVVKFHQITNGMKGQTEAVATAQTVPIPAIPPIGDLPPISSFPTQYPVVTYSWPFVPSDALAIGFVMGSYIPWPKTALSIAALCVGGTSFTYNIKIVNALTLAETNLMTGNVTAGTTPVFTNAFTNPYIPMASFLKLYITAVSGSPTMGIVTLVAQ